MEFVVGLWSVDTLQSSFTLADVNQRIEWLAKALKALNDRVSREKFPKAQTVRGIFLAPEYFLAHKKKKSGDATQWDAERTISAVQRDSCVQRICKLSKNYPNILIIPGSIAWKKTFERDARDKKTTDRRLRGIGHIEHYINLDNNYHIGGTTARKLDIDGTITYRPSMAAKKEIVRGNSFTENVKGKIFHTEKMIKYYMRNTAYVFHNGNIIYKYHKLGDFFESINTSDTVFIPSQRSPIVSIQVTASQKMTFGFEICLDHNLGTLNAISKDTGAAPLDFHTICSASVENEINNMCMRDGGYMLHASSEQQSTAIYERVGSDKRPVLTIENSYPSGFKLEFKKIFFPANADTFIRNLYRALVAYEIERSIMGSKESLNALNKLMSLITKGEYASARAHLDWYMGNDKATQPTGAGAQIPKDKRFYNLLKEVKV